MNEQMQQLDQHLNKSKSTRAVFYVLSALVFVVIVWLLSRGGNKSSVIIDDPNVTPLQQYCGPGGSPC